MLLKLLYLGLAGAAGTLARYGLSGLAARNVGTTFPWGTVAVNLLGCLLFGVLWAFLENRIAAGGQIKMIIFIGFFGAFTTFSTFAFETCQLLDDAQWLWAAGNFLLQTVVGLIAVMAGLTVGRWL
jgi:fluoride exporter